MADFSAIKALIDAKIYDNQSQAITGEALNESLQGMVDAVNELKGDNVPVIVQERWTADEMLPDIYYEHGQYAGSGTYAFYLADAPDDGKEHFWMWTFYNGTINPTIIWDEKITAWFGGVTPTIVLGHTYTIIVINGLAVCMDFGAND